MIHLGPEETATLLADSQNLTFDEALNIAREQLTLKGTYTLHSETAKLNGGDFDFDSLRSFIPASTNAASEAGIASVMRSPRRAWKISGGVMFRQPPVRFE